jgi:hypothetical protein
VTTPPLQQATAFSHAFSRAAFKGIPAHAAIYGDTQRLNQTYAVRFSLKKGELRSVWEPCMPQTQDVLDSLAAPYLNARDSFMRHASERLNRRFVAMSPEELMTVLQMHKAGIVTPSFAVGCDVAVLDPVNLHRGPMVFVDTKHG